MKTVKLSLPLILIGLQSVGCSSDESYFSTENVREVRATLGQFQDGEQEIDTRTSYSISEQSGFQTLWANGDVLGIYPIGGDQVSFPISNGVGTTSAKFDGGSWALRGTYKYAAYYPFSTDSYTTDQRALPVDFTGQVQNGNNSTAHLAAVDFMAAPGTQPSSNGSVNLQFNHVGCFMRMQLTLPEAGTYTCLTISSDNVKFPIKGTVDLSAATPTFKSTETTSSLTLGLTNFTTTSKNAVATFYMMVAPGNYSSSNLTFTLTDTNSNEYKKTVVGKNMLATMAYNYAMTLEGTGTGGNTGGGGWGAPEVETIGAFEYRYRPNDTRLLEVNYGLDYPGIFLAGRVINDNGNTIVERGFYYGRSSTFLSKVISNNTVEDYSGNDHNCPFLDAFSYDYSRPYGGIFGDESYILYFQAYAIDNKGNEGLGEIKSTTVVRY